MRSRVLMMTGVFPLYEQSLSVLTAAMAYTYMDACDSHTKTPAHTNFEAEITQPHICTHLCRNILKSLSHIIGLHFTGNARYVCLQSMCVRSLVSSWQRELSSAEPQNRALPQPINCKEVFSPNLQYYGTYSIQF